MTRLPVDIVTGTPTVLPLINMDGDRDFTLPGQPPRVLLQHTDSWFSTESLEWLVVHDSQDRQ